MSRTYRNNIETSDGFRHPHTQSLRRQLKGLEADARLNQVNISPINRLKTPSFVDTFFND
jgi:hypothetical protein